MTKKSGLKILILGLLRLKSALDKAWTNPVEKTPTGTQWPNGVKKHKEALNHALHGIDWLQYQKNQFGIRFCEL